jgi:hypothetical protein
MSESHLAILTRNGTDIEKRQMSVALNGQFLCMTTDSNIMLE